MRVAWLHLFKHQNIHGDKQWNNCCSSKLFRVMGGKKDEYSMGQVHLDNSQTLQNAKGDILLCFMQVRGHYPNSCSHGLHSPMESLRTVIQKLNQINGKQKCARVLSFSSSLIEELFDRCKKYLKTTSHQNDVWMTEPALLIGEWVVVKRPRES